MRLLTAGSLVRAQQGEPKKAHRVTGALFLLQSGNDPVRSQPQELTGCGKAKPNAQTKRRGAAVNCAGAERARWAMQRGGGGPGNRAMCRGPVARGAARQFPGSEWSLVRAGQGEPEKSASGNRCAFSFAKRQRPCAFTAARADGVRQSKTERTNKRRGAAVPFAGAGQRKIKLSKERRTSPVKDRYAVPFLILICFPLLHLGGNVKPETVFAGALALVHGLVGCLVQRGVLRPHRR